MTLSTGTSSHLYWLQTLRHTRDCFIVAQSPVEAQEFFEKRNGFPEGCSRAEPVIDAIEAFQKPFAPSEDEIARYGIRTYCCGTFELAGRFYISDPPDLTPDCDARSAPAKAKTASKPVPSVTIITRRSALGKRSVGAEASY